MKYLYSEISLVSEFIGRSAYTSEVGEWTNFLVTLQVAGGESVAKSALYKIVLNACW